jgi:hypothetical protein
MTVKIVLRFGSRQRSPKEAKMAEEIPYQRCVYYNGHGKCAFVGVRKCIFDNGMVPFPYFCMAEARMEDEAMFGGEDG